MRASLTWLLAILLLSACGTARHTPRFYAKTLKKEIESSPVFAGSFTGFTLLDPETGRTLCDVQGGHYFTPASTLKILTMATCLAVLADSVPGMRVSKSNNCLYFRGTGDPTFLHTKFRAWQQIADQLRKDPNCTLVYIPDPVIEPLGPGWAWDDASFAFSAERSTLPVYGNTERIYASGGGYLSAEPSWFLLDRVDKNFGDNTIVHHGGIISYGAADKFSPDFEKFLPISHYNDPRVMDYSTDFPTLDLLRIGLENSGNGVIDLRGSNHYNGCGRRGKTSLLYSVPLDTVLRRMMYQSDNFIAEQMLIVCSGVKYDTLAQNRIIQWVKDTLLAPLITNNQFANNQSPRWVDGSGLSRYNLVTPRYLAGVLFKLWREQDHDRLLALFPGAGAPDTTLEWWQPAPATPWLFAKTGSMSGVQCMSGYLRTKRGKTLIFSFMNNNFVGSGQPWKAEMRRILEMAAGFPAVDKEGSKGKKNRKM